MGADDSRAEGIQPFLVLRDADIPRLRDPGHYPAHPVKFNGIGDCPNTCDLSVWSAGVPPADSSALTRLSSPLTKKSTPWDRFTHMKLMPSELFFRCLALLLAGGTPALPVLSHRYWGLSPGFLSATRGLAELHEFAHIHRIEPVMPEQNITRAWGRAPREVIEDQVFGIGRRRRRSAVEWSPRNQGA